MTDDVHTLTGAYALDAVEDDVERRRFERHLADCESCTEEVRSLRETAARLARATASSPPAAMRARVMGQIAVTAQLPPRPAVPSPDESLSGEPAELAELAEPAIRAPGEQALGAEPAPDGEPVPIGRDQASRPSAGRRVRGGRGAQVNRWLAVAASAVVVAGGALAGVGAVQASRAQQAEQRAEQILAIAADPGARRVSGEVTGGGSATVVVAGSRAALLTTGLRPLADDRTYQLWLVRPNQIVSAGLGPGGAGAGGQWSRLLDGVRAGDQVAISVEPEGGSEQPTTNPLTAIAV